MSFERVFGCNLINNLCLIHFSYFLQPLEHIEPVWISQNSSTENILETAISDWANEYEL